MATSSKRFRQIESQVEAGKLYAVTEALGLLQSLPRVKFIESIDVSVNLGIDSRKSDQMVRGALVLPHGTGRSMRVAVFAQGVQAKEAKGAGADIVGFEDLAEAIKGGQMDFDVLIATPDSMRIVGQLGPVLGPRGLMPNPKVGTVTPDVVKAIQNAKGGQVTYRTDKNGIVHSTIGKINFTVQQLKENLEALLNALKKAKPNNAKGVYFKKVTLSSTMGPGVGVEVSSLAL